MSAVRPMTNSEIRTAFVWLCVDDFAIEADKRPKLRAGVDVYQPANQPNPDDPDALRVLVLTGPRAVVERLDAFLRALSPEDEWEPVWDDETPF